MYASSLSGAVKRAEEIRPEAAKENRLQWNLDLTIEPLYNEVLGVTNDFLQAGQNYSKIYGTEPRFNEILVITNTTRKRKRKIYLHVANNCEHVIKDECQTEQG